MAQKSHKEWSYRHSFYCETYGIINVVMVWYNKCGIIMIEEISKPVLVYSVLNFLYNFFFYLKCYMWHFLIHKIVYMIWISCKYFLYYFFVSMCIRSNLNFIVNHDRVYLKIYGLFHFSDIQCCGIFLVKMGYFWTFNLEFKPLAAKKTLTWYILLDSKF